MDEFSRALEALVRRSRTAVRGVGARHGLGEAEIDELFQDVRIRLWKARDGDSKGLVDLSPSYVYRTAVSAALDMIRRRRREGAHKRLDDMIPGSARVRPDHALEEDALARRLEGAILQLHARRRPVVRMYLAGYSREEIADLLGWTEAKTRNLLYRGLANLRGLLGQED